MRLRHAPQPHVQPVAVATLAIGRREHRGVHAVNSVLLKPPSYPRADELVALRPAGAPGLTDGCVSPRRYIARSLTTTAFQSLAWIATRSTITEGE